MEKQEGGREDCPAEVGVREKRRKNPLQRLILEEAYQVMPQPSSHMKRELANITGLEYMQVQYWFGNRRAVAKHGPRKKTKKDQDDLLVAGQSSQAKESNPGSNMPLVTIAIPGQSSQSKESNPGSNMPLVTIAFHGPSSTGLVDPEEHEVALTLPLPIPTAQSETIPYVRGNESASNFAYARPCETQTGEEPALALHLSMKQLDTMPSVRGNELPKTFENSGPDSMQPDVVPALVLPTWVKQSDSLPIPLSLKQSGSKPSVRGNEFSKDFAYAGPYAMQPGEEPTLPLPLSIKRPDNMPSVIQNELPKTFASTRLCSMQPGTVLALPSPNLMKKSNPSPSGMKRSDPVPVSFSMKQSETMPFVRGNELPENSLYAGPYSIKPGEEPLLALPLSMKQPDNMLPQYFASREPYSMQPSLVPTLATSTWMKQSYLSPPGVKQSEPLPVPEELQPILMHVETNHGRPVRDNRPTERTPLPPPATGTSLEQEFASRSSNGQQTEREKLDLAKAELFLSCLKRKMADSGNKMNFTVQDAQMFEAKAPNYAEKYQYFPVQQSPLQEYKNASPTNFSGSIHKVLKDTTPSVVDEWKFSPTELRLLQKFKNIMTTTFPCSSSKMLNHGHLSNIDPYAASSSNSHPYAALSPNEHLYPASSLNAHTSSRQSGFKVPALLAESSKTSKLAVTDDSRCLSPKLGNSFSPSDKTILDSGFPDKANNTQVHTPSGLLIVNRPRNINNVNTYTAAFLEEANNKSSHQTLKNPREEINKPRHSYGKYIVRSRKTPDNTSQRMRYFSEVDTSYKTLVAKWDPKEKRAVCIQVDSDDSQSLSRETGSENETPSIANACIDDPMEDTDTDEATQSVRNSPESVGNFADGVEIINIDSD
ncbi:uncharacterized protein LOC122014352 [Zingiber officinale]|uniref:uncharacterized protein LOC122014352 n=1 Tax=Zingiber officinale TaxID=94328 RepID=UPI001C4B1E00|nr:uncharacterized protein LOC122014352 [Zingiber officinale]